MSIFKGKTIWITGASDGIGKELAIQLADLGGIIILTARNVQKLTEVKESLKGEKHLVFPMDLLKTDAITSKVNTLINQVNRIDMVIHSAGISQRALIKDTTIAVDRKIMELDYFALVTIVKALLPHMSENKDGFIVAISSVAGKIGTPMRAAYCAAKHAIHGFMGSLRAEVYDDNIKVLVAAPGSTKTNISKNALEGDGSAHGVTDPAIANGLSVEECAKQIINGMKNDKQEIIIAKGKERLAVYIGRLFPKLLFKIVRNVKST